MNNAKNSIVARGLNLVLSNKEKKGFNIVHDSFMEKMEDIISGWYMIDVIPKNDKFTWKNHRTGLGHIVAQLHIFLVHSDVLLSNTEMQSNVIPFGILDHKPIVLSFH